MFKFLSEFLNEFDIENETINGYINRKKASQHTVFLAGMEKFPFYETTDARLRERVLSPVPLENPLVVHHMR